MHKGQDGKINRNRKARTEGERISRRIPHSTVAMAGRLSLCIGSDER
ncbi:MAG: hypothetical protein H7A43_02090 [Verrucomicrobia bacterium]|nr:hypothetical protein [Verrucomicrobiota bacterium]